MSAVKSLDLIKTVSKINFFRIWIGVAVELYYLENLGEVTSILHTMKPKDSVHHMVLQNRVHYRKVPIKKGFIL